MPTLESIVNIHIDSRKLKTAVKSLLDEYEIMYGDLEILFITNKYPEICPSRIAEYLYSERASISRGLKSLSERSLIIYKYDNEDRRKVFVTLSKQGASIIKSIDKALSKD